WPRSKDLGEWARANLRVPPGRSYGRHRTVKHYQRGQHSRPKSAGRTGEDDDLPAGREPLRGRLTADPAAGDRRGVPAELGAGGAQGNIEEHLRGIEPVDERRDRRRAMVHREVDMADWYLVACVRRLPGVLVLV